MLHLLFHSNLKLWESFSFIEECIQNSRKHCSSGHQVLSYTTIPPSCTIIDILRYFHPILLLFHPIHVLLLTFWDVSILYYYWLFEMFPPFAIIDFLRCFHPLLFLTFWDVSTLYCYWLFEMFPPFTIILPYTTITFFIYCPPYTTILPCMLIQELRALRLHQSVSFIKIHNATSCYRT